MARYPVDKTDKPEDHAPATLKMPEAKVVGTITWLGEGESGPRTNEWNGLTFKVGEAVDIADPRMIEKAKTNRFYDVTETKAKD